MGLSNTIRFIWNHPLLKGRQIHGLLRFSRWQLGVRLLGTPVVFPFVNGTELLARKGMTGATGNYYVGLMEYEDMSFVLHALRPNDLFIDVGANIGSYSICAASVGASVVAIEPVPGTAEALVRNVELNHFSDSIKVLRQGLGGEAGILRFTIGSDSTNHVLRTDDDPSTPSTEVPVTTLDKALNGRVPWLVKIDVEGFETDVLVGAAATLQNPGLHALIVELNGLGTRYGHDDGGIHKTLFSLGLQPYAYDPFARTLLPLDGPNLSQNTIYIRNRAAVEKRLSTAANYAVLGIER